MGLDLIGPCCANAGLTRANVHDQLLPQPSGITVTNGLLLELADFCDKECLSSDHLLPILHTIDSNLQCIKISVDLK